MNDVVKGDIHSLGDNVTEEGPRKGYTELSSQPPDGLRGSDPVTWSGGSGVDPWDRTNWGDHRKMKSCCPPRPRSSD